jgi:hypothetical protein
MYGTIMKNSPSIRAIFEVDNEGNYTKDAQLYHYILKYCIKDGAPENDIAIRPWDLTDWLVGHYPEWRNRYQGSHLKKYFKIVYNLPRVKRKLDYLNSLFLLEEFTDKAQKLDAPITIYRCPKSGLFLAWLIETEDKDKQRKGTAIQKVYDILTSYLSDKDTSRSIFLHKFFQRCSQNGIFIKNGTDFLISFEQGMIYDHPDVALIELFLNVPKSLYWLFSYPELFIETLDKLDEETRKILLFQFKMEIEGYYDIYLSTKEWEIMRYRNISNYSSVTIPGNCNRCNDSTAFQCEMLEYFRSINETKMPYSSGVITTDCNKCGGNNSVVGRVMSAIWDIFERR